MEAVRGWVWIFSQSFFQAIFYLDLGFLSISYTHAKKVMFRTLMTP